MKFIARAPVFAAGRDQRPGDTFEAAADDTADLLERGHVELVEQETPQELVPVDPTVIPARPVGKKGKK